MKALPGTDIALRSLLADASDDVLLSRKELAIFLGMTPIGVSNGVYHKRLPPPLKVGGGAGIPRWRLGDIRAATKPKDQSNDRSSESAEGRPKTRLRKVAAAKAKPARSGAKRAKRR